MSIEKLADGTGYKVRWRDTAGKSRRKKVTLWRDAVALDGEMKRKKAMGELIAHEKGKIRLEDFYELWVTNYALPRLTLRTQDVYGRLWRKHVIPALGTGTRVREIRREQVAAAVSKWSTSLAPSSVRKVLAVLQSVLERAVEWEYIATNPAKGIRKPRLVQREGRALTLEQLDALVEELPSLRDRVIVRILAGTGMRPGELRGLCWTDWREASGIIVIERAVSNNEIGPTKTGKLRAVEPLHFAFSWLKQWRRWHPPRYVNRDLVMTSANGQLWTDQGWRMWQRQVFKPAAERAGLAGVVPYDLRHTFASQQIAQGIDILTLANQLGHSPTMTLTVYGHLMGRGESVPLECPANVNEA